MSRVELNETMLEEINGGNLRWDPDYTVHSIDPTSKYYNKKYSFTSFSSAKKFMDANCVGMNDDQIIPMLLENNYISEI